LTQEPINQQYLAHVNVELKNPAGYNLISSRLIEDIIRHEEGILAQSGAIIVETGVHTGR